MSTMVPGATDSPRSPAATVPGVGDAPVEFVEVDHGSAAALSAVDRYFVELAERFTEGFDPEAYRRGSAAGPVSEPGVFVLGRIGGAPVACGAIRPLAPGVAEFKRMWVDPAVRGRGLGRRLLAALEEHAARHGWTIVRMDTNRTLTEAATLYRSAGYLPIARYNDNPYAHLWFEKHLEVPPRHGRTDV